MIRLLIVDDSALMRNQLAQIFEDEGGFELRLAQNGLEAVEANLSFQPDVVTLDINMPKMDGIAALSRIMAERPVPVVMLSAMTEKGAFATLEALNLGAVDFITKSGGSQSRGIEGIRDELLSKVRGAYGANPKRHAADEPADPPRTEHQPPDLPDSTEHGSRQDGVVLIGASTGGPRAVEEILKRLPADLPWPIVVAQHMPSVFTKHFANRLDKICALNVIEAVIPMVLKPGTAYLAKGGGDLVFTLHGGALSVIPKPENRNHPWHPSLELLGRSILEHREPSRVIGVMLTGTGSDGVDAFAGIKKAGGRTIAESESSAVVFDMPGELIRRGGATAVLPMEQIAAQIVAWIETEVGSGRGTTKTVTRDRGGEG